MRLYGIFVPKNEHWYAKDLCTLIYNKLRPKQPKMTNAAFESWLQKQVRKRYKENKNTKTLVEVLKEMWQEIKEEG